MLLNATRLQHTNEEVINHMPTYEYLCQTCTHRFEKWQKMTDDALTVCPECGGHIRRVFYPAGIVFKGSGFYKTDHKGDANAAASAAGSHENGHTESSGEHAENGKQDKQGKQDEGGKQGEQGEQKNAPATGKAAASAPGTTGGSATSAAAK